MTECYRLLNTREAAAFLIERGYKVAPATLNKLRSVGGGPEFQLFGRYPVYSEDALLDWARLRTTEPKQSTRDLPEAA